MSDSYIVMKDHRVLWKILFMSENMKSERHFWIFFSLQILNISFLFRAVLLTDGIEGKIAILVLGLCIGGGIFSYATSFVHHETLHEIVANLQTHYDRHKSIPEDLSIIQKCYDEGKRMHRVFSVMIAITGVAFLVKPLIITGIQRLRGVQEEVVLPLPAAYPWKPNGVMFYVSFLLQIILVMWGVVPMVIICGSTTMFFCLAIVSQLKLAQRRFQEVLQDSPEAVSCMKTALRYHQEALATIKNVEKIENFKLFTQIFLTTATLSMCLFMVSRANTEDLGQVLPYVSLSLSVLTQLALLCSYGQKVIDEGDKLFDEIYAVPWYGLPRGCKGLVVIALMRAQRADRLTAWSFFDVSMSTLNNVITKAFSYFTFLQTMSE